MLGALRSPALEGPLWEYQGLTRVNLEARNLMMREQGVRGLVTPFSRFHPNHGLCGTRPDWPWQVRVPLLEEGSLITYRTVGGQVHQIHPYPLMAHDLMMGAIKPDQKAIATAGEEALTRMGQLYL